MRLAFQTITSGQSCFDGHVIDMSACTWCDPWAIAAICLKAVELKEHADRGLLLPADPDVLRYLKRMHFDQVMASFGYEDFLRPLQDLVVNERDNIGVHEIIRCDYRDEFEARLKGAIRRMLLGFGMRPDDEAMTTALIGEMGNNVYDHNEGLWPTDVRGALILAQHYPKLHETHVVVADPGIGFLGSLLPVKPALASHQEAILLGLSGVTGRVGERRGNGLLLIQDWTVNRFRGEVRVQSGDGLIIVNKAGKSSQAAVPVSGTLVSFVIHYG